MKVESHLENLKESVREIEEAIAEGLIRKQRTIGFHSSCGAVDMLEIMLHQHNLIDPGFIIKHEWFNSSRKIAEKLAFDFPHKKEIVRCITEIEHMRNMFCYGKRHTEEELARVVQAFNTLKALFVEATGNEL